jgi:hypothetical protein
MVRQLLRASGAASYRHELLLRHPLRRRNDSIGFVVFRSIDQGEAEAEDEVEDVAAAVLLGALFSGVRMVFSTVTVRAGGAGGVAPSLAPPLMRPRKNPNSTPRRSPTASVSTNALAGPDLLLAVRMSLLLPMVLFPHRLSVSPHSGPSVRSPRKSMSYLRAIRCASWTPHAPASYEHDAIAPSQVRTSENFPSTHSGA